MGSPLIEVKNLSYYRDENPLWKNISFSLAAGKLLQIIGENGSGKTTLLRTLTGIITPYEGEIFWQGQSIKNYQNEYLRNLYFLGHRNGLKAELTVLENLYFNLHNKHFCQTQHSEILDQLGLLAVRNKLVKQLSQGQRQRVALAKLLSSQAKLWILDEPFTALDAQIITIVQHLFCKHLQEGGGIILTSHRPLDHVDLANMESLYEL